MPTRAEIGCKSTDECLQIWEAINDGTIYSCPSLLASFTTICFADLKKYIFTYHFGFPAIRLESTWKITSDGASDKHQSGNERGLAFETLDSEEAVTLVDRVQTWRYSVDSRQYGFFLAKKQRRPLTGLGEKSAEPDQEESEHLRPLTPGTLSQTLDLKWEVGSLAAYEEGFFNGVDKRDQFVCFADPSSDDQYPGWMLRNLLALVRARWSLDTVQILCYRETHSHRHAAKSKIIQLRYDIPNESTKSQSSTVNLDEPTSHEVGAPKISGWETNNAKKTASKVTNLGEYMDPQRSVEIFAPSVTKLSQGSKQVS